MAFVYKSSNTSIEIATIQPRTHKKNLCNKLKWRSFCFLFANRLDQFNQFYHTCTSIIPPVPICLFGYRSNFSHLNCQTYTSKLSLPQALQLSTETFSLSQQSHRNLWRISGFQEQYEKPSLRISYRGYPRDRPSSDPPWNSSWILFIYWHKSKINLWAYRSWACRWCCSLSVVLALGAVSYGERLSVSCKRNKST